MLHTDREGKTVNPPAPFSETAEVPEPLSVMGMPVHPFESYGHAVRCIAGRIESGVRTFCTAINPEKVYRAIHDPEIACLLRRADMCICDGIGIVLAARILHGRRIARCTGIRLFLELIREAPRRGWTIFLVGASAESNALACWNLQKRYPRLRIVGHRDGFFEDSAAVVGEINAAEPDMLFVATGSPRQEKWISQHADELAVPFRMGIGGALDVLSGKAKRAPKLFRTTGMEFLYRLLKQPGRWRRQVTYPMFMAEVFRRKLRPVEHFG